MIFLANQVHWSPGPRMGCQRVSWQELSEGTGRRGMEPRDGLVPQPIAPPEI
jgi:hypothetical protein